MSQILDLVLLCLFCMFHGLNGEWVENKGLWYYISPPDLSVGYGKAVSICDTLNAGLAVIVDVNQTEFLERKTNDRKYRWIGLSNNKTSHNDDDCEDATLVWNNDRFCDINVPEGISANGQFKCTGVAINNGIWTAKNCSENHGFICQWQCKRIYMHFESTEYSGVYTFGRYYNNNFRYYKEGDRDYRIYKSGAWKKWAVVKKTKKKKLYKYIQRSDIYVHVPYREEMSWSTEDVLSRSIRAGSFCVDCDRLTICLFSPHFEEDCYSDMTLNVKQDSLYPKYINSDTSAIIRDDPANVFDNLCIDIEQNGLVKVRVCGYLFPYPKRTTQYLLDNNDTLSFTNLCARAHIEISTMTVPSSPVLSTVSYPSQTSSATATMDASRVQTSFEEYTTSTYELTISQSPSKLKSTPNNKTITLSVSIAAVVIVITIVATTVSIIFIRRRKRKEQDGVNPGGIDMRNDNITNAQCNNNVYIELPESNSKRTIKDLPAKDSNGGYYSYGDFATPGSRQAFKEIDETGKKPSEVTNDKVAPIKGYLAPDYGVLIVGKGHANNTHETNEVYLEISDSKTKTISNSPEKSDSDYDLQLHENDVYDSSADDKRPDNEQDNNVYYNDGWANAEHGINQQTKPEKQSNEECLYQNTVSDSGDAGHDELELFENSVYEHT